MIKQLIIDIAYDNISLSQALTRSKIIESKVKNEQFKKWLKSEAEGYEDGENIPGYRIIPSQTFLVAEFQFGRILDIEVLIPDVFAETTKLNTYFHTIIDSVKTLENNLEELPGAQAQINLPIEKVTAYSKLYESRVKSQNGVIRSGHKIVSKAHIQNIIEQSKNKLLDILMDLNEQFPNLENDFENNLKNNETVSNIITNNIYAPNNNLNNAAGSNISISSEYNNTLSTEQEKNLKDLGVNDNEIQQLNTILAENNKDKPEFGKKLMAWCASVGSSLAGRGIYDALPKINEFITQLM
ncbi:hypothetical protein [Chryseobacterium sp. WLY505]|uniref:AbiTii domain-containing protein n=1 Tax=Chryseobacterium sp. WLY505 TaxID=3068892 RepID=UPI0027963E28|nr:hypothetical protein [Chryseobacterium sp. WLY505]MDQ1855772.1 hypothetical protein [Chryseobacterium sp. WLY505]